MDWTQILNDDVIPAVTTILLGALTALVAVGVRYAERRLSIDIPARTERAIADLGTDAVAYAEQIGRRAVAAGGPRPVNSTLLESAIEYARTEARRRRLPELARDELVRLIESRLGHENALRPTAAPEQRPAPSGDAK